jgi:anti-sigma regulatory factor (Ser/Thr protein kinase)
VGDDGYVFQTAATPAELSTVRIFARSVARSLALDEDAAQDLELLTSELCAEMIESGATAITLRIWPQPALLRLTIEAEDVTVDPAVASERRDLLDSLAPGLRWHTSGAECALPRRACAEHES